MVITPTILVVVSMCFMGVLNIYMYIYMYVCMYACMYVCIYLYLYIYILYMISIQLSLCHIFYHQIFGQDLGQLQSVFDAKGRWAICVLRPFGASLRAVWFKHVQ